MFKNTFVSFLVATVSFIACKQQASSTESLSTTEISDSLSKIPLYPYPQYIEQQIAYVDSTPLGIELIEYKDDKLIDSGFIDREKFKQLAQEFISPDPNRKEYRKDYEENSFQDLSMNAITFTITAKKTDLPLQQADILLNPDNQTVKYLILKKIQKEGNKTEQKNLMWVHNMNFQISTSTIDEEGKESVSVVKVVWDKPMDSY